MIVCLCSDCLYYVSVPYNGSRNLSPFRRESLFWAVGVILTSGPNRDHCIQIAEHEKRQT